MAITDDFPIPKHGDQHKADVRANQRGFQERFGDFKTHHVMGLQIGPAPKGEWIGILFEKEDGDVVRVSIPFPMWQAFGQEYVLAMMSASELVEAAYAPPKGSA